MLKCVREGNSPIVYDTSFAPVVFLDFVNSCKILSCERVDEKVTLNLSRKEMVVVISLDSKTGCPHSIVVSQSEDNQEVFSISATDGGFNVLESIHERNNEKCI